MTVSDTGPGIPDEIQHRVFERFTRAEASRVRTPGAETGRSTGLGLAIVAAVVEAHHGSVAVESRPGPYGVRRLAAPGRPRRVDVEPAEHRGRRLRR